MLFLKIDVSTQRAVSILNNQTGGREKNLDNVKRPGP